MDNEELQLRRYRTACVYTSRGYKVVPVDTNGVPCFSGFYSEHVRYTAIDIAAWQWLYPTASNALVCGDPRSKIVALDIDVDDYFAVKELLDFILEMCPEGKHPLIRKRNHSMRAAVVFKAKDDLFNWVSRARSATYVNPDGDKQVIEYLGWKSLLTMDGVSRKNKLSWYSGLGLWHKDKGAQLDDKIRMPGILELGYDDLMKIFDAYEASMNLTKLFTKVSNRRMAPSRYQPKETITSSTATSITETISITETAAPRVPKVPPKVEKVFTEESKLKTNSVPLSDEEINFILNNTDGNDRENWLNVGIALWNHYKGSLEGFERWDTWSQRFRGRKSDQDQRYHWSTMGSYPHMTLNVLSSRINREKALTAAFMKEPDTFFDAFRASVNNKGSDAPGSAVQKSEEEYKWMLDNFVLIAQGGLVGDMTKSAADSTRTIAQMRDFYRNKKYVVEVVGPNGQKQKKKFSAYDRWLEDPNHLEAWCTAYVPNGRRLILGGTFSGQPENFYNTYCPPMRRCLQPIKDPYRATPNIKRFLDHMAYLFPNDQGEWMLNWMAQMIQQPEVRYRVSPFSISLFEGTGRGWLTDVLARLVGHSNFATVRDVMDIVRPGAKSGYLDGTVLLVVNEVYVSSNDRFSLLSQLKTILSDDTQEIDVKYGIHTHNQRIYTRVFFQSNHLDGLVIDETDSRIQPFVNRAEPKSKAYYDSLYSLSEHEEFLDEIYTYLIKRKVDISLLKHSSDTEDRKAVIKSSKSPTALAFFEFKNLVGVSGVFTESIVNDFVYEHVKVFSPDDAMVNSREFRFLKNSLNKLQRRVPGLASAPRSFGFFENKTDSEIKQSIRKTEVAIHNYFTRRR